MESGDGDVCDTTPFGQDGILEKERKRRDLIIRGALNRQTSKEEGGKLDPSVSGLVHDHATMSSHTATILEPSTMITYSMFVLDQPHSQPQTGDQSKWEGEYPL